jgi:uncharacterized BrkB/YihY/UPF0761 family membrane protein
MSETTLLVVWVVIAVLILLLGVVNSLSVANLEKRVEALDSTKDPSVLNTLRDNWDIVVSVILGVILLSTLLFKNMRSWYGHRAALSTMIFVLVFGIAVALPIVNRKILKKNSKKQ